MEAAVTLPTPVTQTDSEITGVIGLCVHVGVKPFPTTLRVCLFLQG